MIAGAVEPLIGEARARQRRRRLGVASLALLALAAAAGGWFGTRGGSGSTSPSPQEIAAARALIAAVARRASIVESGLTGGIGWAMNGYAIWLTSDGGRGWLTATPPDVRKIGDAVARILQVEFLDRAHGWISASDTIGGPHVPPGSPSLRHMEIDRTSDGGRTWRWSVPPGCLERCAGADLDFLDLRHGYAIVGGNRTQWLFASTDGGASWTRVAQAPFRGAITFLDARRGFGVSDPFPVSGGRLYRTTDGGRTWHRIVLAAGKANADSVTAFGSTLVVPVRLSSAGRQRLVVEVSHDGGATWTARPGPAPSWFWAQNWDFPDASQFSAATPSAWVVAGGSLLHATADAGRTWRTVTPLDLPAHSTFWEVHFTSAFDGWAIVHWKGLDGAVLMQTRDGGRWWAPLAPPVPRPKPLPPRPPVCSSSCYRP